MAASRPMNTPLPEPKPFDEATFIALAVRQFDEGLGADETARFETFLETYPEARDTYLELTLQAQLLSETPHYRRRQPLLSLQNWSTPLVRIGAAAAAIAVGMWLWMANVPSDRSSDLPVAIAQLTDIQGNVALMQPHKGSSVLPAQLQTGLHSSDGVITRTPDSQATVRFIDGTVVNVTGDTEASFHQTEEGKRIIVRRGRVSADVSPQPPGCPLVIETATAQLRVLGTTLCVAAEDDETRLDVSSGKVAITRSTDGSSTDVAAGEFVVVNGESSSTISAERTPELDTQWHPVFDETWSGKIRSTAIGVEIDASRTDQGYHAITTPNAWYAGSYGHFQASRDSYLHLTFKMERPQWFHLITCTRTAPHAVKTTAPTANFIYQDESWWKDLQPGEWRTISIPLAEGRRPGSSTHPEILNAEGRVVYNLLISTNEFDRGLTLQRIWVDHEAN